MTNKESIPPQAVDSDQDFGYTSLRRVAAAVLPRQVEDREYG
jgi:hypothetical protein